MNNRPIRAGATEIVASALQAATQEMSAALIRAAYSPNVKERGDCSTAICDIGGRTLSLTAGAPAHLGSTLRLVPQILKRFPLDTLRTGDVFLANDPYIVGVTHLNDCTIASPVFYDGNPIAFVVAVAHHSDVGGRVPGSEAGDSTSIFQEGIRVPPVMIHAAGVPRRDVIEMFLLNSRTPDYGRGDLMAQIAATERGARRLLDIYARNGAMLATECIEAMLDATGRRVAERIRSELKEGVYHASDWLDDDGVSDTPVKLAVELTVCDGSVSMNFAGCAAQIGSGKNVPLPHTLATAYFVLKMFVDPAGSTNEGLYRAVEVIAPEGCIVNPVAPAAVSSRNATSMILADVLTDAFGQACPSRMMAAGGPFQGTILSGWDPVKQRQFIDYENFSGGQGASCRGDGMDAVHIHMTNTSNLPIESMEIEFPVRVERYELRPDSGGAGRYRGGLGILRDFRILGADVTVALRSARQRFPAAGRQGGANGDLGQFILNPGSPGERKLPSTSSATPLATGDLLRVVTPGGGGVGNPAERDRAAVDQDLAQGKITDGAARSIYGLVPNLKGSADGSNRA
jgi:N-methylhydantoinase B